MKNQVILNFSHFKLRPCPEILKVGSKVENRMILIQCPHFLVEDMEAQSHGVPCQGHSVACGTTASPCYFIS